MPLQITLSSNSHHSGGNTHKTRKDGREARGNEEREKREDEKGSHYFFKSSGNYKLELKHQNLVFSSL